LTGNHLSFLMKSICGLLCEQKREGSKAEAVENL